MAARIYAGQYGWVLYIDFGDTDVTGASTYTMNITKPDGTTTTWTAALGATTTQITYTVEAGDVADAGYYLIQPYIAGLGDFTGYGLTCRLQVHSLYD